jgi:DNA topoisomerase-2
VHFSIANGINTRLQGSHVKHVLDRIVAKALPKVQEKAKDAKATHVRDMLSVVLACDVVNPRFTSQAKEELAMPVKEFGSEYVPDEKDLAKLLAGPGGLVARAVSAANATVEKKATDAQAKTSRKAHLNIPKLDDAHDAGTRNNKGTVLQVTEGDSAKVVALRGMEELGRQKYGAFPLRGKLLNAMKATKTAMLKNEELKNLREILGLQVDRKVSSLSELRYTSLMILTDADPDGKHIAGLILCFIAAFWPELLSMGFVSIMLTPVVKATHRRSKRSEIFYDLEAYRGWQGSVSLQEYDVRYYKGLGTSTAAEAKGYYKDIAKNLKQLTLDPSGMDALRKMFEDGKEAVEQRKQWIGAYVPVTVDYRQRAFAISEYVDQHVIEYCLDDIGRSLPAVDGFKTTQRKVLWALLQRSHPEKPLKVCQLSGYVAEKACYHHGETSLNSTIIGMNQDFLGKNQLALLQPHSNFGTRLQGGSDASQPRYIDTSLAKCAEAIFPKEDLPHLPQQVEDGQVIEPRVMIGVIPMLLVNPASGIAVGWNSSWPPFELSKVTENIVRLLAGQALVEMDPFYRGFKGSYTRVDDARWDLKGVFAVDGESVHVAELPPGKWPGDQKEKLVADGVQVVDSSPSTDEVDMRLTFETPEKALKWVDSMTTRVSTAHMNVVDAEGRVRLYKVPSGPAAGPRGGAHGCVREATRGGGGASPGAHPEGHGARAVHRGGGVGTRRLLPPRGPGGGQGGARHPRPSGRVLRRGVHRHAHPLPDQGARPQDPRRL